MDLTFSKTVLLYLICAGVFAIVDLVWLGKVAPKLYRDNIGHLMAKKPNFLAAAAFYSIFLIGLMVFAIVPALNNLSFAYALGYGGLFGLVSYATFDLTGQAVLKDWPVKITIIDMSWGMTLCAVVSSITYLIASQYI